MLTKKQKALFKLRRLQKLGGKVMPEYTQKIGDAADGVLNGTVPLKTGSIVSKIWDKLVRNKYANIKMHETGYTDEKLKDLEKSKDDALDTLE
jgi:hypothetical protein